MFDATFAGSADARVAAHRWKGGDAMVPFTPGTPLEAAVLESGRFELATDTAGREVMVVGQRRLPKVVMLAKADGVHGLMEAVAATGAQAFASVSGDPWQIAEDEPDHAPSPTAAEEYLVMGLRPLLTDRRPVRVAAGSDVIRLFLLPWTIPARTVGFGGHAHFVVTSARGVVGDWEPIADGRHGVVVGVSEAWIGILERYLQPGSSLVLRCDVPVPWVGDGGLTNAVPHEVGVFDAGSGESWVAKLPVVFIEGDVVRPVEVPPELEVGSVPDGPWELEAQGSSDFSMGSLT